MHPIRNRFTAIAASAILAGSLAFAAGSPAVADTAPANPADPLTPTTVTADGLPTAQINGVAWTQVIIGNTVYVGGQFTTPRPARSTPGVNQVPRAPDLASDLRTGHNNKYIAPGYNTHSTALARAPAPPPSRTIHSSLSSALDVCFPKIVPVGDAMSHVTMVDGKPRPCAWTSARPLLSGTPAIRVAARPPPAPGNALVRSESQLLDDWPET